MAEPATMVRSKTGRRKPRVHWWGLMLGLLGFVGLPAAPQAADSDLLTSVVWPDPAEETIALDRLEVRVDGESAELVSVAGLEGGPGEPAWQVLVYFDTPLLTPDALEASVELLSENAAALSALGPVTITVADPEPRDLLTAGAKEHLIREALDLFADETTLAGELLWRRLRHLNAARAEELDDARRERAIEQERALLERQRHALSETLTGRRGVEPGLLILVQSGFDLDFKRFYLSRTERLEGLETDLDEAHARLGRIGAAAGWTVLPLSLGEQGSEFDRPREPLRLLAEASGGEVITSLRGLRRSLAAATRAARVSYRAAESSGEPRPLEVLLDNRRVRGPLWAGGIQGPAPAAAASGEAPREHKSSVRLLSPGAGPHVGPTRLTAITGEHEVGYVAFFLDGFLVDVSHAAPFQARIDLGPEPVAHTVRAAAYSPGALELGEDVLRLNQEDRPFRVEIVDVVGDPRRGRVELEAAVSTPFGRRLERLDFFWNQELRTSLSEPPYSATIETASPGPTDHYRVVATLDDGARLETARMASEAGLISERLDINLVELYAMVSDRGAAPPPELTRDDFELFHDGQTRQIERVARAEEVPLTLGLAVDTSQSLSAWHDDLREAAAVFFENALGDSDQAFLTDFDVRARLTQEATRRRELLVGRMAALDFGGYTSLYDAILFSLAQFEGQGGRKALVVLTDGDDYSSRFRPGRCIEEAVRLGVPIYMVVVEDPGRLLEDVDRMTVARLARQTGGRTYFFTSRERLEEIYEQIVAELRSQYLLTWASDRPLRAADLRDIRVEVRDPNLTVRTVLGSSVRRQ